MTIIKKGGGRVKKWHYEVLGAGLALAGFLLVLGAAGTSDTRPEVSMITVTILAVIGIVLFWIGLSLWQVSERVHPRRRWK